MSSELPPLPDGFTLDASLAYIYLVYASTTDNDLAQEELDTIALKLSEWDFVDNAVNSMTAATEFYRSLQSHEERLRAMTGMVVMLKEMPAQFRAAVLTDLMQVAAADGKVHDNEVSWLTKLADVWGIEIKSD